MGNQFNFFQYEGTGADGKSYRINPIATYFTGVYFPAELIEGSDVGFVWRIRTDDAFYPSRYDIRLKGEVGKSSTDYNSYSFLFSGNLFPVSSDSGLYSISGTGQKIRDNLDIISGTLPFSGSIKSGERDTISYSGTFSGEFPIFYNDNNEFDLTLHCDQLSYNQDYKDFTMAFSGGVVRKNKDSVSIDFNLTGVSFTVGGRGITITTGDTAAIDLNLSKVFFNPP
jgi:hypothetical protein